MGRSSECLGCSAQDGVMRFRRTLVATLACLTFSCKAPAQSALEREYQIKAAYVYNFINYIEWPADALPPAGGTLTIGVLGEDPFGPALDPLNGKQIKGRTLAVKQISS